jgi:hypothetical protein
MLAKTVQVVLDFRGTQTHFAVLESASEEDFKKAVRPHLSLAPNTHITVIPLGLDSWQIKAGFTYAVMESRQMKITLHDTSLKTKELKIAGNASLNDCCELLRAKWNLPPWTVITVERCDKKPFWVEDKGEYIVATRYDPDLDTRPLCTIRIDTKEGRTFLIENYRCETNDPTAIWADIMAKHGFPVVNPTQMTISGISASGLVTYKLKLPISYTKVNPHHFVARSFKTHLTQDPWCSGEVISPATHNREQVWEQLQQLTALQHVSQFQFVQELKAIFACQNWPHAEILAFPHRFPVIWQIETFSDPVIQQNLTAQFKPEDAWQQLRHGVPRLFEKATFNYAGFLQPGQTIKRAL